MNETDDARPLVDEIISRNLGGDLYTYEFSNNHTASSFEFIKFDVHHVAGPLILLVTITSMGFLKSGFALCHSIPHSSLLIMFGTVMGLILSWVFPGEEIYLKPDWFFVYLLPFIVLEAGYFLKNKDFFLNFGTIGAYAVVGTLFNTSAIATSLYFMRGSFALPLSFGHIAIFSTLICAVDPVAVLSVFEDIHVNELLYISVFGESLLNDAVTVVLYHTITHMVAASDAAPDVASYGLAVVDFGKVSVGGIFNGVVGGLFTALISRMMVENQMAQPVNMIVLPLITYLLTDAMHLSGILAIVTCGILIKNYMKGNCTEQTTFVCEYVFKMASSYADSLIFVFLGISLVSDRHFFDWWFIMAVLVFCLLYRFIGVFVLTYFLNMAREENDKFTMEDQFVMAYGGIRGAVCYGLVMSIDDKVASPEVKNMLATTTLIVILFTTLLQGSTIKWLVNLLQVKRSRAFGKECDQKRVFDYMANEVNRYLIDFLENITQHHNVNGLYRFMLDVDERYVKPILIANYRPRNEGILERHVEVEISNYVSLISGGSFGGLPQVPSSAKLSSASASVLPTHHEEDEPLSPPSTSPIPRNESISGVLHGMQEAFELQQQLTIGRKERRSMYSRHLMDMFPKDGEMGSTPQDSFDEQSYMVTYPYSQESGRDMAGKIRAFSKSLKDKRMLSPARRYSGPSGAKAVRSPRTSSLKLGSLFSPGSKAQATTAPPRPVAGRTTHSAEGPSRATSQHVSRPRVTFSNVDETDSQDTTNTTTLDTSDYTPRVVKSRTPTGERKVSVGKKNFYVGTEDTRELNPIDEQHDDEKSSSSHLDPNARY